MKKELYYCSECQNDVYADTFYYGNENSEGWEITCEICGNILDED